MRHAAIFAASLAASVAGAFFALDTTASTSDALSTPTATPGPSPTASPSPNGSFFGDFDCNNVVEMDDATIGLEALAFPIDNVTGSTCEPNTDPDCNQVFDGVDILAIVRFVAELPLTFPGCPTVGDIQFELSTECANLLDEPVPIPDTPDPDPEYIAALEVEILESKEILSLALCINIEHHSVGDLVISLKHEDTGTVVTLVDRIGNPANSGNCAGHGEGLFIVFADSGAETLHEHCADPATSAFVDGAFKPDESLAAFEGEDIQGTWA